MFADSYRREIDRSENVWRTLPFFSASVAFELAAVIQFRPDFRDPTTLLGQAAISVLAIFMALLSATLAYLWLSIRPRQLVLATPDDDVLAFEQGTVAAARAGGDGELTARQAKAIRDAARDRLLIQWATSATVNRRTNQLRELHRARASRFLLLSIAAIPILIAVDLIQSRKVTAGVSGYLLEHSAQTAVRR